MDDFLQDWYLAREILWHWLALSLIIFEDFVADRRACCVKDNRQIARIFFLLELSQGDDKAVNGIGRKTRRGRKALDGVVGAVEERIPINQKELFFTHFL